jgi:TP901 family phage tail tape measure protein
MAETTEGVIIENEINVKTDKAVKNVEKLNEVLLKNTKLGKDIEKLFKSIEKVKGFDVVGEKDSKNIKDLSKSFNVISDTLRKNMKYFKSIELSLTKQAALLNKVAVAAQKVNIQYGTNASASANINKTRYAQQKTDFLYGTPEGQAYASLKQKNFERKARQAVIEEHYPEMGRRRRIYEGIDKWREKQEILNQTLGVTQLRLLANYAAINSITSGFKTVLNYTVQYDKELRQLQAIAAISDTGLQNLKTTIEGVANSTKFSSLEIAQASTVLAQAGLSVSQIKDTLPSIANLATGTGTDLATATDVITSTLNIYELQVTEATRVTNSLTTAMNESKADISGFQTAIQYAGNFAAQLGMTYEETAAAIAAATQAGIRSKSMLGTGLRAVLVEFMKPTEKLVTQLESVGLTVDDINVKSKGFNNVLKTLANAGFGAEEAFKGMERRGAAFLSALIRQTDYMDDLRMSMAGSTAAAEANEIQMKSLSAQWDNFQSILKTAGASGIEPVTKGLSALLNIINDMLSSDAGNVVGRVLFGTTTIAATATAAGMLSSSITNIIVGLVSFGKHAKKLTALSRALDIAKVGALRANFVKLGAALKILLTLPMVKWIGVIALTVSAIYEITKATGLWTSELDKLKASLEENNGSIEKTSSELNTIASFTERLYTEQEKLNNEAERNIFAREMITRLPQARKFIDLTNVSVEDLKHAMEELNGINLKQYIKEVEHAAKATKELAEASGKEGVNKLVDNNWLSGTYYRKNTIKDMRLNIMSAVSALSGPEGMAFIPRMEKYGRFDSIGDFSFSSHSDRDNYSKDLLKALKDLIAKETEGLTYKEKAQFTRNAITMMEAQANISGIENPLIKYFNDLVDSFEAANKAIEANLEATLTSYFKEDAKKTIEDYSKTVDSATVALDNLKDSMNATNHEALLVQQEALDKIKDSFKALDQIRTFKDFAKYLGDEEKAKSIFAKIKAQPHLKDATDTQIIKAYVESQKDFFNGLEKQIYNLGNRIADALVESAQQGNGPKGLRSIASDYQRAMNRSYQSGDLQGVVRNAKAFLQARLGQDKITKFTSDMVDWDNYVGLSGEDKSKYLNTLIKNLSSTEILKITGIFSEINYAIEKAGEKAKANQTTVERFNLSTEEFFKRFEEGLNKAEQAYNSAMAALERPLAIQRGVGAGYSDFFGSSSEFSTFASNKLNNLESGNLQGRKSAIEAYIKSLEEARRTLISSDAYRTAQ